MIHSEFTTVGDDDVFLGFVVAIDWVLFDLIEDIESIGNLSEDDVGTVEMGSIDEAEEELGAVGAWTSVGHGEDASAGVLVLEVLIIELSTIDTLTASTVSFGEIATLSHEIWNDSVEFAALEVEGLALFADTLLTSAESSEVFSCLRDISVEVYLDSASCSTANCNIEDHF